MYMDGLALHYYTRIEDTSITTILPDGNARYARNTAAGSYSATRFERKEWDRVMRESWFTEELVTKHTAIMDTYDPQKKVALIVDEWGTWFAVEPGTNPGFLYQQNTLRDALVAGMHLNIFNHHADRVRMANIAQMINVLQAIVLTDGDKMVLTPTYHVFDMFKVHQDAMLLEHHLTSASFDADGVSIPQVNASVSQDAKGRIHITLCNVDAQDGAEVACILEGVDAFSPVAGTVLTSEQMQAHNDFARPDVIAPAPFTGFRQEKDRITVEMPSKSIILLTIG